MPRRAILVAALSLAFLLSALYALSVRRGAWEMRGETPWEVAASGYVPFRTKIYTEQHVPAYPRAVEWLEPAFAVVHVVDLRVRWTYWHVRVLPHFDEPAEFMLTE